MVVEVNLQYVINCTCNNITVDISTIETLNIIGASLKVVLYITMTRVSALLDHLSIKDLKRCHVRKNMCLTIFSLKSKKRTLIVCIISSACLFNLFSSRKV